MEFSTENQAIIFQSEESEGENEHPLQTGEKKQVKQEKSSLVVAQQHDSDEGGEKQKNPAVTLDRNEGAETSWTMPNKLPLFELDLSEEDEHVQEDSDVLPIEYRTRNVSKNDKPQEAKTPQKFTDITPEISVKGHKITEKNEDKYESKHISQGLFNKSENNQSQYNEAIKETFTPQKLEIMNNSNNFSKKLPPILTSPKKEEKHFENESMLGQQSSIACLNKFLPQVQIAKKKEENSRQHEQMSLTQYLPFKKIPRGRKLKYLLIRQKNCPQNFYHPQFSLKNPNNSIVFAAKKEWGHLNSHYHISLEKQNYSKESDRYLGLLQGNFTGTYFNLFQYQNQNQKKELVATIHFKPDFGCCSAGFRVIQVYIKSDRYTYEELDGAQEGEEIDLKQLFQVGSNYPQQKIVKVVSKTPEWSERKKAYVINFRYKGKIASSKNTILIDESHGGQQALLFCKTDADEFYLQITYPLTNFIAFGVVLTVFDFKLLCE